MIRAINRMVKLDVIIEMIFPTTKMANTSTMTFFRLNLENNNGMIGPDIATPIAKILTNHPAVATLTSKYTAISSNIPIYPISVFNIPKTPTVKINTIKLFRFFKKTNPFFH